MATIPNVVCPCTFVFLLLSFVGLSQQRTVSGEESRFLMEQIRVEQEKLFRPPALLADLQVPEGELQPAFTSNNFNYTVIVPDDVHDVHVTAKLALGKENDRFRVRFTSSNHEADVYGSMMLLRRNASTIYVELHVSSHKLQTSTYLLKVVSGPSDVPASHDDDNHAHGAAKRLSFWAALLNTLMIFGAAMVVSSISVYLYGMLASLRSRRTTVAEGYQQISGRP